MLASLAAAALALMQDKPGLAEVEKAALDVAGLTAEFEVVLVGRASVFYARVGSHSQRIVVRAPDLHEEFVQTPEGMVYIDHIAKTYEEFMPFPELASMPPVASGIATFAQIPLLRPGSYRQLVEARSWEASGVHQGKWRVPIVSQDLLEGSQLEIETDASGQLKSANQKLITQTETIDVLLTFTKFVGGKPETEFSSEPPVGYVPTSVVPTARPVAPGERVNLEELKNPVPPGVVGRRALVLFTRPDCGPSQAGSAVWRSLANQCQNLNAAFVEVTVGARPGPPGTHHDRDGEMARRFGLTETPALFALESQYCVAAWYGFRAGEDKSIVRTLLEPWSDTSKDGD